MVTFNIALYHYMLIIIPLHYNTIFERLIFKLYQVHEAFSLQHYWLLLNTILLKTIIYNLKRKSLCRMFKLYVYIFFLSEPVVSSFKCFTH